MNKDYIIGQKLKELRNKKGLTLEEVGKKLGITRSAMGHYEAGRRTVSADMFMDLMDIYDVDDPNEVMREIRRSFK